MMTEAQRQRYKRHILLPEIDVAGQKKLLESKALVIGAGGLGAPLLLYLAAAGVGHIGIADFDNVDLSNLQRQVIFSTADIGSSKAESAAARIKEINPDIKAVAINARFDESNARQMEADYDIVLDATDNISTKYLINDTCVELGKPLVHAAVNRYGGNVMTIVPGSACLRCVFPEAIKEKDSSEYGILGVIPGIAGTIQAAEAVKLITGIGDPLADKMLSFDALSMNFNITTIKPSGSCIFQNKHFHV